ncbi:hypothetical protein LT679_09235 [Mucilaginibacter roseus]|uniref:Uncharacterized protein n=1 Tax=Mucilaginibacter roseus TaxID=1528868 RepID=A0ABS8U0Z5_9SPHI|nr:hypothetical protein [Mucilaginibacter roseus]MCD8740781.1 hypothetical protein [Mucilaginibacter roseus]
MTLKPQYSVTPHGIKVVGKDVYAVFKMVVSIADFNNKPVTPVSRVTGSVWANFLAEINAAKWTYNYTPASADGSTGTLEFSIISLRTTMQNNNFQFLMPGQQPDNDTVRGLSNNKSINYGLDHDRKPRLGFAGEGTMAIIEQAAKLESRQMQSSLDKFDLDRYHDIFKKSGEFADENRLTDKQLTNEYDFRTVYSTILNEPQLAETHYGIIREIIIPVGEMLLRTTLQDYKIKMPDGTPDALYTLKNVNGKYYNGLQKMFFYNGGGNSDFNDIRYYLNDPYKQAQEDVKESKNGKPHPDGIYALIAYKPNAADSGINNNDPFRKGKGVKGFNVIVKPKPDKNKYASLSWHQKVYTFKKGRKKPYIIYTSGCMNPRAEMVDSQTQTRTNLLFAWRGDNLIVNRELKASKNITDNIATGFVTDKGCENRFINDEIFTKQELLIRESQIQLLATDNSSAYHFYVRTVGYTEHCLPLEAEVLDKDMLPYTLTVEDVLNSASNAALYLFGEPVQYNLTSAAALPIKALNIVGPRVYNDPNPGYVDNGNHLVLNELAKEKRETRYLYPPSIKLEDVKFLGYLSPEKLKKRTTEKLSLNDYVRRCKRLEDRNSTKLPNLAISSSGIDYLADPRGSRIVLFPADLYTLSRCKPSDLKPVFIFNYQALYPFYNKTRSGKLSVIRKKNVAPAIYNGLNNSYTIQLNNDPLFKDLPLGIYLFKVYITDADFTTTTINHYNEIPLRISLVGKPAIPIITTPTKNLVTLRNTLHEQHRNYWFLPFDITDSDSWKSLKYTEDTEVLRIDQPAPADILSDYEKRTGIKQELMLDEYPYDIFLQKEGDAAGESDLRVSLYPASVTISIQCQADSPITDNSLLLSLNLNDSDKLTARKSSGGFKLFLNSDLLKEAQAMVLIVKFVQAENHYELFLQGTSLTPKGLKNYINPDITIQDIEIPEQVMQQLAIAPASLNFSFNRGNKYIFITDMRHPYSAIKRFRLFASSPFQAYFPKVKNEFELGSTGVVHQIFVPNNVRPETPVLNAGVLLMHVKDESWNDEFKESATSSLIRLTLNQDFMKEGRNLLGIVLKNISAATDTKNVSLVGDDITKLSNYDISNTTIEDFIDTASQNPLFSKYIDKKPRKIYLIDEVQYEVLRCVPYYNADLKKWQVVLPFKYFRDMEALFVKLVTVKIAPGHDLKDINHNIAAPVYRDRSGTNLSSFAEPEIFPVYNKKQISIKRTKDSYTIEYIGPFLSKPLKMLCVMLLDQHHHLAEILSDTSMMKDMVTFNCATADPVAGTEGKILLFSQKRVTINRPLCHTILVLEFEVHANYKPAAGQSASQPFFVSKNPLFEMEGTRLINVAEFKA